MSIIEKAWCMFCNRAVTNFLVLSILLDRSLQARDLASSVKKTAVSLLVSKFTV
jgi:hypothetical protein